MEYEQNDDVDTNELIIEQDPSTDISVEFHDANSFKCLLEMLKSHGSIHNGGNMVFTKEGIKYEQSNVDNTILSSVFIYAEELCEYVFISSQERFIVGFSYDDICGITKDVSKKDRLRMYKVPKQNQMYMQIIQQNGEATDETNLRSFKIRTIAYNTYDIGDLGEFSETPVKVVDTQRFKKMTDTMTSIKSKYITIQSTDDSIIINASKTGTSSAVIKWGNTGSSNFVDRSGICQRFARTKTIQTSSKKAKINILPLGFKNEIVTDFSTIKSLSKFHNLSTTGTLKLFMNSNALKIEGYVGTYGLIVVYIRSNE